MAVVVDEKESSLAGKTETVEEGTVLGCCEGLRILDSLPNGPLLFSHFMNDVTTLIVWMESWWSKERFR